jgi:hypothetical protein
MVFFPEILRTSCAEKARYMNSKKLKRWAIILASVIAVTGTAATVGLRYATKALKGQVEQALGPESEVGEIVAGWSTIEVRRVRIRAPKGWPAADALRAQRIVIAPDLLGLVSGKIRIDRIDIDQAYISVLRTRDGRLRLLPSLLERPKQAGATSTAPAVSIGAIELRGGAMEYFDATVRQPAHKIRLEQLHAKVADLEVPSLSGRTRIDLDGTIKGVHRNGTMAIAGWTELADKNSELSTKLRGVDLIALQPYLIKATESGVRRGTMDLDIKSKVRKNQLNAPGTITLSGLELAPSDSGAGTFMGVPRQAVVTSLKDRDGKIVVQFVLEGNLNDPKFSLNESFAKRMGTSVAALLGISIEGLARGVGGTAEGLGGVIKNLFGQ